MSDLPLPPKPRRAPKLHKKASSGYYYSVFYDPSRRPARKWYALQTDNKRRATKLHTEADEAYFAGTFDPWRDVRATATPLSLAGAIERYAAAMTAAGTWRAKTLGNRRSVLDRFAATLPAGIGPEHVTPADVKRFVDAPPAAAPEAVNGASANGGAHHVADPTRQTRSAGTRRTYIAIVAGFFAWCVEERLATTNPAAAVKAPRLDASAPVHLQPAQLDAVLRLVRSDALVKAATGKLRGGSAEGQGRQLTWLADFAELAAYTALRPSEISRLRWKDVDLPARTLYVRNTAAGRTKTGGERAVPLAAPAVATLERLAAERPTEKPGDPVVLGGRGPGVPASVETASRLFRRYAKDAGLDVTLYALRRTLPSWLASAGVSTAVAQRILGHASGRTTEAHYAAVWDESARAELDRAVSTALGR